MSKAWNNCRFCGSDKMRFDLWGTENRFTHEVIDENYQLYCKYCGNHARTWCKTKEDAVVEWNKENDV